MSVKERFSPHKDAVIRRVVDRTRSIRDFRHRAGKVELTLPHPDLSPRVEQDLPNLEVDQIGKMTFVSSPNRFAKPITNEVILTRVIANELNNLRREFSKTSPDVEITEDTIISPEILTALGLKPSLLSEQLSKNLTLKDFLTEAVLTTTEKLGVRTRYCSPPKEVRMAEGKTEQEVTDELIQEEVEIGANLLLRAMAEKNWDSVDAVVVTSSFLPEDMSAKILEYLGWQDKNIFTQDIRIFCGGGVVGFIMSLDDPRLKSMKRVVQIGLEPIGFLQQEEMYTVLNMSLPITFGDEHLALAYSPIDYKLEPGASVVFKDDEGVIKINTMYDVPEHDPTLPSNIYAFPDEGIATMNRRGIFMKTHRPPGTLLAWMDGVKTGLFFKRNFPKVLMGALRAARKKVEQLIMHEPSSTVFHTITSEIRKLLDKLLDQQEVPKDFKVPETEFSLTEDDASNSSSTTAWRVLINKFRRGEFDPHKPFAVGAPGIGAVLAAAVVSEREPDEVLLVNKVMEALEIQRLYLTHRERQAA